MREVRKYIPLTEDDKSDVVNMRLRGVSIKEIAEYIGCSVSAVCYHIRKANVGNERWDSSQNSHLVKMYNEGKKVSIISQETGYSEQSVKHRISYLRKLGYHIKYRKRI